MLGRELVSDHIKQSEQNRVLGVKMLCMITEGGGKI